ncbi:AraC family transcriptional regulator [Calothrix sp. UHCC 0171]|uniref:AraC family transcriptional regulator n=1 Tax=Calothrix sp. UHCC 0171 TaxID=3110245 RepID=UPI002B1EE8A5|nr:AraC family transcriptional regulator [Calothrix sp. UHCC 0171]MEA5573036.1 AraC family transcriptional regulator [Calothrix sp. UHCC 0171]
MINDNALVLDIKKSEDSNRLLSHLPTLSSQSAGWNHIFLAHYQTSAHECPEHYYSHHLLWLNLNYQDCSLQLKSRLGGKFGKYEISRGSIGIVPANIQNWMAWNQNAEFLILALCPEFVKQVFHELMDDSNMELIAQVAITDSLIEHIMLALKADIESEYSLGNIYAESLAATLTVHLLKHYSVKKRQLPSDTEGLSSYRLKQAIDYIQAHLEENIKLSEIAAAVGMSQYYFIRLFKQSMGMTPYNYVIEQRLERAKQMLKHQDLALGEISARCGFADQSHFTRYFKRQFGVTPQAMRNSLHTNHLTSTNCQYLQLLLPRMSFGKIASSF